MDDRGTARRWLLGFFGHGILLRRLVSEVGWRRTSSVIADEALFGILAELVGLVVP